MSEVSKIEERQKLIVAASYRSDLEHGEKIDITYGSFRQVMMYRRDLAIKLLECNEFDEKHLRAIYESCNDKIRNILGL